MKLANGGVLVQFEPNLQWCSLLYPFLIGQGFWTMLSQIWLSKWLLISLGLEKAYSKGFEVLVAD